MDKLNQIQEEVNKVIKGKNDTVQKVLAAVIAGGHILMEDIPGVGKTTLSTTFAKTLSMDYKRVQFTPDVLPSDILGFSMYNSATKEFEFREGPIFCNFFFCLLNFICNFCHKAQVQIYQTFFCKPFLCSPFQT